MAEQIKLAKSRQLTKAVTVQVEKVHNNRDRELVLTIYKNSDGTALKECCSYTKHRYEMEGKRHTIKRFVDALKRNGNFYYNLEVS